MERIAFGAARTRAETLTALPRAWFVRGMADAPLVTVVTPSYNYGRYLAACLASVRAQTHPRIEHLVLDACSNDATPEVLSSFAGTYALRSFFEKDGGQSDALNKGFARAKGDVLCWLNADDYWAHERVVEQALERLSRGFDVVTGSGFQVDGDGRRLRGHAHAAENVVREVRYHCTFFQPATFWRRAVHRPLRDDLHYVFDWQLWLDFVQGGAHILAVPDEWAAYRMHGTNKSAVDPAKRRKEVAAVLARQFGSRSPQALWADAVYQGFRASEAVGSEALKRMVLRANAAMYFLTRRRVVSS